MIRCVFWRISPTSSHRHEGGVTFLEWRFYYVFERFSLILAQKNHNSETDQCQTYLNQDDFVTGQSAGLKPSRPRWRLKHLANNHATASRQKSNDLFAIWPIIIIIRANLRIIVAISSTNKPFFFQIRDEIIIDVWSSCSADKKLHIQRRFIYKCKNETTLKNLQL